MVRTETALMEAYYMSVTLDHNQWNLIYNIFSFGLISMLACTVYTLVSQSRVLPKYRNALVMSSMVTVSYTHLTLPTN